MGEIKKCKCKHSEELEKKISALTESHFELMKISTDHQNRALNAEKRVNELETSIEKEGYKYTALNIAHKRNEELLTLVDKMMEKTFRERLREILESLMNKRQRIPDLIIYKQSELEEALSEILKLVKEIVPDRLHNEDATPRAVDEVVKVWNECRQTILTNLGGDKE